MVDDAEHPPQPPGAGAEPSPEAVANAPEGSGNVVPMPSRAKAAPPPSTGANAPDSGAGGDGTDAPKDGKGRKAEKTVDWGKFNYLLENFVLIYPTDTAWDRAKRKQVKIANIAHMYGADYVRMWKASPDRQSIDEEDLVFDPTMRCGSDKINLYDGFATVPVACTEEEVQPMLDLLLHLCDRCKGDKVGIDAVVTWVLRWLALPLQQPGAKPRSALVFHGPQGTGKNLFFDVMKAVYGRYAIMVGQTEIEDKFNGWMSAKLFIIGNEVVSRQELYHNKNRIKWLITEPQIPIRDMQTTSRQENNHANVVFLSNEKQPLVLEADDRRYLVVYTPVPEATDLYKRVRDFLANGGAAKWMHYLQHYPLGDFDEHTKPLMTEAKEDLIELSMRSDERFMREWVLGFLHLPMCVCSAEQLYRAFRKWCDNVGERYPPPQHAFTATAKRWALERVERGPDGERLEPVLSYKVCTLPDATNSGRRSVRCWLPRGTGPRDGVSEGAWVGECVDSFETLLSRFLRTREGGGDTAAEGGKE